MTDFQAKLGETGAAVSAHLRSVLAEYPAQKVTDAMGYALGGGKGLRGFLVVESGELHGIPADTALWPAAAVEALHAYSLVHDDLPAMDDDDMRRGQPTVHVKWDEATAILAGDALQTLAFELLTDARFNTEAIIKVDLAGSLARASGGHGMVYGQALDIAAETAETALDLEAITELQANKTGALIRWSAEAGARLAQADIGPLSRYAEALGLAFQIADDVLDVTGDAQTAGKRLQKDADAGKATFVSLLGLDGARARATSLVDEANEALSPYGAKAERLRAAASFVIARDK